MSSSLVLVPATVPSAPSNPVIVGQSSGSMSIEWEASVKENGASIQGYRVEYKTLSDAVYS